MTGCAGPGSRALVYVEMQLATTSPGVRYDVGVYFRTDAPAALNSSVTAGNVGLSGRCVQATVPPSLGDADGDACGDLNGTATCVVRTALNLSCVDLVGQGDVTVPVCVTWSTSAAGSCSSSGLLPSSSSKCACYIQTISGLSAASSPSPKGVLYAPANSVFPEDKSAGGPAPPAPPSAGPPPAPPWVRAASSAFFSNPISCCVC